MITLFMYHYIVHKSSLCWIQPWPIAASAKVAFTVDRSSRPKTFCKNSVFKKFTKFTGKHLFFRTPLAAASVSKTQINFVSSVANKYKTISLKLQNKYSWMCVMSAGDNPSLQPKIQKENDNHQSVFVIEGHGMSCLFLL